MPELVPLLKYPPIVRRGPLQRFFSMKFINPIVKGMPENCYLKFHTYDIYSKQVHYSQMLAHWNNMLYNAVKDGALYYVTFYDHEYQENVMVEVWRTKEACDAFNEKLNQLDKHGDDANDRMGRGGLAHMHTGFVTACEGDNVYEIWGFDARKNLA